MRVPVFFHPQQLEHKPNYEWAFGEKLDHPESTRRAETILAALTGAPADFDVREPRRVSARRIREVHSAKLLTLYRTARSITQGETFHPSVFPKRNKTSADPTHLAQAGYFCFDSGTPLASTTWDAAFFSASCALEAGHAVDSGRTSAAYALCRPPGHHASRALFGGYCYFNNAALVARQLRRRGRGAILDIDFHHGNGTQDIFYRDGQVLFISIHGDPQDFYPFFTGYSEERGADEGEGTTINLPVPAGCDAQAYLRLMDERVLPALRAFQPQWLVISAGFDTFEKDPIGRFALKTDDYAPLADRLSRLGLPTVIVQEGGYAVAELGLNVASFLRGFRESRLVSSR